MQGIHRRDFALFLASEATTLYQDRHCRYSQCFHEHERSPHRPGPDGPSRRRGDPLRRHPRPPGRRGEGRAAASILGGTWHCLEARDLLVFYNETMVRRANALLRRVRPHLVIAHSPQDYMPDHEQAFELSVDISGCMDTKERLVGAHAFPADDLLRKVLGAKARWLGTGLGAEL